MLEFSPGEFQHCVNSPGEKYNILDFSLTRWDDIQTQWPMGQAQLLGMCLLMARLRCCKMRLPSMVRLSCCENAPGPANG